MKGITIVLFTLLSLTLNGQKMATPQDVITSLFIATDQRNWEKVQNVFDEKVLLDYSSMNGNPASELTPQQIITAWKGILPGFESTHHQIGNFIANLTKERAAVFCYGIANHYLQDEQGNLWTVVGTYDFELVDKKKEGWKIADMKFNFKYQDGNTSLPEKAMNLSAGQQKNEGVKSGDSAEKNKQSVKDFFKALEDENVDRLINLFAEDAQHINPYASGLFPTGANGKAAIKAYWIPVFPNFDGMEFPIEEIYAMEDPSRVFVKFKGKIKLKNDAGYYENDYYATFKFNTAGLITEYVEIFNPIVAARGFGLINKIK